MFAVCVDVVIKLCDYLLSNIGRDEDEDLVTKCFIAAYLLQGSDKSYTQ